MRGGGRAAGPLAAVLALSACLADATEGPDGPAVERRDSAGVEIVTVGGEDHSLDWTTRPLLTLGGEAEGPASFYTVARGTVAADEAGRIYVLDVDGHRIQVFDTTGAHLRTMGREGDGPGELRYPSGLDLDTDSTLAVWDFGRRRLVRFTRAGEPLETERIPWAPVPVRQPFVKATPGALLVAHYALRSGGDAEPRARLLRVAEGDTTEIASLPRPMSEMVMFEECGVGLRLTPIFHPEIVWDAAGRRSAHTAWPEYHIEVREDGVPLREIRRDVPPLRADRATALEELGEGRPIRVGSAEAPPCRLDPERMLDEGGFVDRVPTLERITLAPDGAIWARRSAVGSEVEGPIDLFAPDGAYVGTLPADFPEPLGFLPGDRILTSETDEFDVDRLVVRRVERGSDPEGPGAES